MAGLPTPKSLSPVGLDIGPAEVRAVQLLGSPGAHDVVNAAVFPRRVCPGPQEAFGPAEARFIADVLARRGFVGRRVAVIAPHGAYSAHVVDLPARDSGAPADMIARAEVARNRRCPSDSFELAAWYLPQRGKSEQGMAVACDRPGLEQHLGALEDGGLVPVGVDIEEAALARVCLPETRDEPGAIHAVVRVGWGASLGVLAINGVVVYTRRIEFGASSIVSRFAERTGLPWREACRVLDSAAPDSPAPDVFETAARAGWLRLAERVGAEIDTAVTYVSHAYRSAPIGRVMLAGYGGARPELVGRLDEALGMPVAPTRWWGCSDAVVNEDAGVRTALAAALARRFDA